MTAAITGILAAPAAAQEPLDAYNYCQNNGTGTEVPAFPINAPDAPTGICLANAAMYLIGGRLQQAGYYKNSYGSPLPAQGRVISSGVRYPISWTGTPELFYPTHPAPKYKGTRQVNPGTYARVGNAEIIWETIPGETRRGPCFVHAGKPKKRTRIRATYQVRVYHWWRRDNPGQKPPWYDLVLKRNVLPPECYGANYGPS